MKAKYDAYAFAGGDAIPAPMVGIPVVDKGPTGPSGENLVWVRPTLSEAFFGPNDAEGLPMFVYILDSTSYDGLRRINERVATSTIAIFADYVAETMAGTARVGFKDPFPHEFCGFKVHASEVPKSGSNLDVMIYSAKGAAWDKLVFSQDMQGISDIHNMFETPIFLAPDDRIDVTWDKDTSTYWGIELYVRKLK